MFQIVAFERLSKWLCSERDSHFILFFFCLISLISIFSVSISFTEEKREAEHLSYYNMTVVL